MDFWAEFSVFTESLICKIRYHRENVEETWAVEVEKLVISVSVLISLLNILLVIK